MKHECEKFRTESAELSRINSHIRLYCNDNNFEKGYLPVDIL